MFLPLLRNNIIKLKQALIFSACFFYFVFNALAQNKWERLPGVDVEQTISALVVDSVNNTLIIGSEYLTHVNGQSSCSVFKWDSSYNVEILDSFNSAQMHVHTVRDIIIQNDSMFVGGDWGIVIYNNGSWIKQVNGDASAWDINVYNNEYLLSAGLGVTYGTPIKSYLFSWDGDSSFQEFENISNYMDISPAINVSQEYKGELYVAGRNFGSGLMNHILKWNGTQWEDVGGGIHAGGDIAIYDMEVYQGELYVAGQFEQIGSIKENHIARWDGVQWKPVGGGIQNDIFGYSLLRELHVHDGYLYVGGRFGGAGGVPAEGVARWDGNEWCGCGSNILEQVISLNHYRDTLYIGGAFALYQPTDSIYSLARFIGTEFADTCGSIHVGIKTLAAQKKQLIGYPNPAKEVLTLKIPNTPINEVIVSIFAASGQIVREEKYALVNQELPLRVNPLPSGMYFGEIRSQSDSYRFSFVKE